MSNQGRRQGVLGACPKAANEQRSHKKSHTVAEPGQDVSDTGERCAKRKNSLRTEPLGDQSRRNLAAGESPGKNCFHEPKRSKAKAEFALPERQHNVDEVGVAVVQGMCAAGNA